LRQLSFGNPPPHVGGYHFQTGSKRRNPVQDLKAAIEAGIDWLRQGVHGLKNPVEKSAAPCLQQAATLK
jgi:hypothetical protein